MEAQSRLGSVNRRKLIIKRASGRPRRIQAVVATGVFGSMATIGQALRPESSNLGFFAVSR
jgi:hypothetical protein